LPSKSATPPVLEVQELSRAGAFKQISLSISPGECLGFYGFVGAGHQELAHAIAGALRPDSGRVVLNGTELRGGDIHQAVQRGVVLVAADRAQTLVRGSEIYKNVTLAHLQGAIGNWLTAGREIHCVQPLLERVLCRPARPRLQAGNLSGGNQQKVVLAKWLSTNPRILILDEPTRGIDIGTKAEVHHLMSDLAAQGIAILMISSELPEVLGMSDRILVMHEGQVTGLFSRSEATQEKIMLAATQAV